jgi:hypothetical protein
MNLAFGITMFFFGLFGLISIIGIFWALYKKKPKRIWIISVLLNVFLFVGSIALYNYQLTPEEKNAFVAQREQQKIEQEVQKKTEQPQVKGQEKQGIAAPETKSPESIFTSIANKSLGKNFIKIEVKDFVDDSTKKIVLVYYKGHEGYNSTTTQKVMFSQTADLFKNLFAAGIPIQEATAFIYADMTGPSGSKDGLAMKCQLKGSTATSIDWGSFNKTKFDQYLDYVWLAPGLRE